MNVNIAYCQKGVRVDTIFLMLSSLVANKQTKIKMATYVSLQLYRKNAKLFMRENNSFNTIHNFNFILEK